MALIRISPDVFVNPNSIDALEFVEGEIFVIVGDRTFLLSDTSPDKIQEIQNAVSGDPRNIQHFVGHRLI